MDELLVGMPEEIAEGTPDGLPKKNYGRKFWYYCGRNCGEIPGGTPRDYPGSISKEL